MFRLIGRCSLIFFLLFATNQQLDSQTHKQVSFLHTFYADTSTTHSNNAHELTIFVFPTLFPLDWTSPSSLFISMKACYLKTLHIQNHYLLGHLAIGLRSPLLPKPIVTGMKSSDPKEKTDLVLKHKIGYGILGATLKGALETEEELTAKMETYMRLNKLGFITFRINETAAQRIIDFIHYYTKKNKHNYAPCDYYGGSFWPLYEGEGAGCSNFAIALTELVNIPLPEKDHWLIKLNVPLHLVGGEYNNNNNKVRNRTLKKTNHWHNHEGQINIDYVRYFVYEPNRIYQWILEKLKTPEQAYIPRKVQGISGLIIDKREVVLDAGTPMLKQRSQADLYVDKFKSKYLLSN